MFIVAKTLLLCLVVPGEFCGVLKLLKASIGSRVSNLKNQQTLDFFNKNYEFTKPILKNTNFNCQLMEKSTLFLLTGHGFGGSQ